MKTEYITDNISLAADIIKRGGLVAVPTETVYGLAGNGLDAAAVKRIYAVKGRQAWKPLSLMVSGPEAFEKYGQNVSRGAHVLAHRFWPGPLTIVVEAAEGLPEALLAGGHTVGLRCPDSEKTLALLRVCGLPLAAPSANPSGKASPKETQQVSDYFDGVIDAVIDGGPCGFGQESTVVDLSVTPYRILREGALPAADIREALIASLKIIGITGGSGTGKTTALDVLRSMGVLVIDADHVYHELCIQRADMLAEIEDRFPGVIAEGVLQRKKLGSIVFSDPKALADLRSITDKYVVDSIDEQLALHAATGGKYAAVDAVNIVGTALQRRVTALVGILAPEEERAARLVSREHITPEYARMRIRAQKPDSYYERICTHLLRNDGSLEDYQMDCRTVFHSILEET